MKKQAEWKRGFPPLVKLAASSEYRSAMTEAGADQHQSDGESAGEAPTSERLADPALPSDDASRPELSPQSQVVTDLGAAVEPVPDAADPAWQKRVSVIDVVGRGAMGTVMRARDARLQREFALKVAAAPRGKMPSAMLARFIEEAQITAQLEHPNVVPVHDLSVDPEGRPCFSMKLVRGQSLADILQKRCAGDEKTLAEFGLRRLLEIFLQVCQGIEYAHARGVVHRDLKPANVMVGDFGEVLVMDWGVAKVLSAPERDLLVPDAPRSDRTEPNVQAGDRRAARRISALDQVTSLRAANDAWTTQHGELIGTVTHMAPEQADGQPIDQRSDVYSLGVILYEILCGQLPFAGEQPIVILGRLLSQQPARPSEINPAVPRALEMVALRLLDKNPARRLTIAEIRAHVHNYLDGIDRDYRRESLWSAVAWVAGALALFAFLVWYLTGESVAAVLALGPPAVLNAVGWYLVALALGYPLWSIYAAIREVRSVPDRFHPPNAVQTFLSGYMAHRTFASSVAPLSQLVFFVELLWIAIWGTSRGAFRSSELHQLSSQLRTQWAQALIVIAIFLFGYLFSLSREVRFARKIDRYQLLVARKPWESVWPFFLVFLLLSTVVTTDVFDWFLSNPNPTFMHFLHEEVTPRWLNPFDVSKTLVFQGTFLLGLVVATVAVSFPLAEILAAFRMPFDSPDEALVSSRSQYFFRSLALFRVLRTNWLYGGAMVSSLTAITVLSGTNRSPLIEKVLYVLGPSVIGFIGYWVSKRYVDSYLAGAMAVRRRLDSEIAASREAQWQANLQALDTAPLRWQLLGLLVPIACVLIYLVWTGSGIRRHAIARLLLPLTTEGWLLILPYLLLVPLLVLRDRVQRRILRTWLQRAKPRA